MKARGLLAAGALGAMLLGWLYLPSREAKPSPTVTRLEAPSPPPAALPRPLTETVTAAVVPRPSEPAPDAERLLRELELLSVTDKPQALQRALAADAQLSPNGIFAEARRALIVTLLVDTDRMAEARARAREYIARYPQSRYLPIVQGTTGIHPRPTPSQLRDAR